MKVKESKLAAELAFEPRQSYSRAFPPFSMLALLPWKHHHSLASTVTMETPSRQPPLWRCGFMFICRSAHFFFSIKN